MDPDVLVYYPGHLEPRPVSILRSRPAKVVWSEIGLVRALPYRDGESLVQHGGFLRALPVDEAMSALGVEMTQEALEGLPKVDLARLTAAFHLDSSGTKAELISRILECDLDALTIANHKPRNGDPVRVVVVDHKYRAVRRALQER